MLIINIFLSFTFIFVIENEFFLALYVLLSAAAQGGHFTIFAPLVVEKFGSKYGPEIYSKVLVSIVFGTFG